MKAIILGVAFACVAPQLMARSFMLNPYGLPDAISLNGRWNAIIDPYSRGGQMQFCVNRKPQRKSEFWNTVSMGAQA